MAKKITKINVEFVEQAFKNLKIEQHYNAFIEDVTNQANVAEKIKADIKAEEAKKITAYHVQKELPEDYSSHEEFIEFLVDDFDDWYDTFYEDDMDDYGVDDIEYFLIGDKLFEVGLHCEAEWVSDWSVRANLPGKVSITSIKEIEDFTLIKNHGNSADIKLK